MLVKLKAVYTLVEQLYTGTHHALATISPSNQTPALLVDVLRKLYVLPQRIGEMKRSCARAGAVTTLSRAKAWLPELYPSELSTGCPSLKEEDTLLTRRTCVKEICPLASLIANETDLSQYQLAYGLENQKMPTPSYKVQDLITPICKHTFAPEVNQEELIDDKAEFQALSGIDWSSPAFQELEQDEDTETDDPETSGQ